MPDQAVRYNALLDLDAVMPIRPIMPGFLANTFFYAVMLYVCSRIGRRVIAAASIRPIHMLGSAGLAVGDAP